MIEQQVVVNPGFEIQNNPDGSAPAAWVTQRTANMDKTVGVPYSGSWCARLSGWSAVTTDYVYQDVAIPEFGIAQLGFKLSIANDTVLPDDPGAPSCTLTLEVQDRYGTPLKTFATWDVTARMTGNGWYQEGIYDLSQWAGSTVRLRFSSAQTNATRNTFFYVDDVRLSVLLNLPVSSFPPLVSDMSRDTQDQIQQYGNRVYCSCLIHADPGDLFFNPAWAGGLTGYGANGSYYENGIENSLYKAAWYLEALGGGDAVTRGPGQPFPSTALVLVTDQSIAILDQIDFLSLWMIFKKKPDNAYSDTFNLDPNAKFVPSRVDYDSGVLSVTFEPAEGSPVVSTAVLCIDFVQDFIYLDLAL